MTLGDRIVSIATQEIGVREEGGNNRGDRIVVYQKSTWLEPAAWPWCAAFTCWVLHQALQTPEGIDFLAKRQTTVDAFRCKDASAFGWIKWADKRGLLVFDEHHPEHLPEAGDFVVFDFSHIGIVSEDMPYDHRDVITIEGNTNGRGDRDSTTGDGVWSKHRNKNLVRAFIRVAEAPRVTPT